MHHIHTYAPHMHHIPHMHIHITCTCTCITYHICTCSTYIRMHHIHTYAPHTYICHHIHTYAITYARTYIWTTHASHTTYAHTHYICTFTFAHYIHISFCFQDRMDGTWFLQLRAKGYTDEQIANEMNMTATSSSTSTQSRKGKLPVRRGKERESHSSNTPDVGPCKEALQQIQAIDANFLL